MAEGKKRFVVELIVAGSAVIISLCALIISYKQVNMMEEQMHLSVIPRLSIGLSTGQNEFTIGLINNGIGPAEIIDTELKVDGKVVLDWKEFFNSIDSTITVKSNKTTSKLNDILIGQQSVRAVLSVKDSVWPVVLDTNRHRISMKICYKSLYNDWFEVERKSFTVGGDIVNRTVDKNTIDDKNAFLVRAE